MENWEKRFEKKFGVVYLDGKRKEEMLI